MLYFIFFTVVLTFCILIGSGIRCIRDRAPSVSEHERFAGKWTQLQQHDGLQDLFQGVFEELPDGGVSWKLHFWQSHHTSAGHRLVQHPAGRPAAPAAQLYLAGKSTCARRLLPHALLRSAKSSTT